MECQTYFVQLLAEKWRIHLLTIHSTYILMLYYTHTYIYADIFCANISNIVIVNFFREFWKVIMALYLHMDKRAVANLLACKAFTILPLKEESFLVPSNIFLKPLMQAKTWSTWSMHPIWKFTTKKSEICWGSTSKRN